MPTSFTHRLADSFRAVRWAESSGKPSCAKCYDGLDVRAGYRQQRRQRDLRSYFCACCKYAFGDATGTPLEHTSRPLALWAFVALGGTWAGLGLIGLSNKWKRDDLRDMARRLGESEFVARWVRELRSRGITVEQVAATLKRRRL